MDAWKKWMIKTSLLLNGLCSIQASPPKQQPRPLPSLVSLSVFYMCAGPDTHLTGDSVDGGAADGVESDGPGLVELYGSVANPDLDMAYSGIPQEALELFVVCFRCL